jgi:immune inhibitor A
VKKKALAASALTLLLVGSTLAVPTVNAAPTTPGQSTATNSSVLESPPIDINTIPEELLTQSLQDRGGVSGKKTTDVKAALQDYLNHKSVKGKKSDASAPGGSDSSAGSSAEMQKKVSKANTDKKADAKQGHGEQLKKDSRDGLPIPDAKQDAYTGSVRKDKVLVLLTEFSDFKHNNVDQRPGYMWAPDFNQDHYQRMIFGDQPFQLQDGSTVQTFKQFYEEQSGGSYTVEGTVSPWLTVPGTAKEYGDDNPLGGHDNLNPKGPRDLIKDTLKAAAASGINLADYDHYDQYDMDGDGNYNEPDGLVDHLMVIHAGVGQEAGGGKLGDDAIWSHRWTLNGVYAIPGTTASVDYWGGKMGAYDYTVEPEDGATGVFAHEFGHDLGLPDEYDTNYSGQGEPVGVWSIMSGGSWGGKIAGTQPTSFSAQNKQFFQNTIGGNWANIKEVNASSLDKWGYPTILAQSVTKSKTFPGIVRVNLPDKPVQGIVPAFGAKYYYSTKGDDLNTSMTSPEFDLTNATKATFDFKAYYQVEFEYDYLHAQATTDGGQTWTEIDTIGDDDTNGDASSETSNGKWVDKSYDLSAFAGKKVQLRFNYVTDGGLALDGFALDNATLTVDGAVVFSDDAEGAPQFTLDGFVQSTGFNYYKNYYLLEWRNYAGADTALQYARGAKYNTGLLVWYADESYLDNWVGIHPGNGFLGVVDSHPHDVLYFDVNGTKTTANSSRYQVGDAAFSFDKSPAYTYTHSSWGTISTPGFDGVRTFDDSKSYLDAKIPDAGRLIPKLGLKIDVIGESKNNTAGAIWIHK